MIDGWILAIFQWIGSQDDSLINDNSEQRKKYILEFLVEVCFEAMHACQTIPFTLSFILSGSGYPS